MQAPKSCPKCGEYKLYRSRSRNKVEKILKSILPIIIYRCHNCKWRGWLSRRKMSRKKSSIKIILFYLVLITIAAITANFLRYFLD